MSRSEHAEGLECTSAGDGRRSRNLTSSELCGRSVATPSHVTLETPHTVVDVASGRRGRSTIGRDASAKSWAVCVSHASI